MEENVVCKINLFVDAVLLLVNFNTLSTSNNTGQPPTLRTHFTHHFLIITNFDSIHSCLVCLLALALVLAARPWSNALIFPAVRRCSDVLLAHSHHHRHHHHLKNCKMKKMHHKRMKRRRRHALNAEPPSSWATWIAANPRCVAPASRCCTVNYSGLKWQIKSNVQRAKPPWSRVTTME